MKITGPRLTLIMSWIAGIAAAAVALALPLGYFCLSYQYHAAAIETEAEINARLVTRLINANPEMWRYEELRLLELMKNRPGKGHRETRRIRDARGEIAVESSEPLARPLMTKSAPLFDAGTIVGRLEIVRSLRPLLVNTGLAALFGTLLGLAAFLALRVLPLRALADALASLFEEQERAQVTLRSIGDGVIATDTDRRVVMINAVAEQLTGWPRREAEGRYVEDVFLLVHEKNPLACENPVEKAMQSGEIAALPHSSALVARDGSERTVEASGAPIRDREGNVIGAVLVFRDVSEKRMLEEEILKARKLESIGVLAGGIAHDFNNILTAVMGNVSLAQTYLEPGHDAFDRLTDAENACLRAKDLTYQLLTFSRGGAPVKKTTSLAELVRESSKFALSGSRCRCEFAVDAGLWPVEADAGQLNQVFHNIVINAVEAMPEGGVIRVSAANVIVKKGQGLPLDEGPYVRISVTDHGVGITREHLDKIFDPYFTTKQRGSGLGLATCYSIVRKHGGHIGVVSERGRGATFVFHLPASPEKATPQQAMKAAVLRGKGRVLLMDDEIMVRNTARAMLTRLGYEVALADDGRQAISLYEQARASGKPFDAVMLDLTVPAGMGGKEAMSKLAEIDPGVKAIVSSGYSNDPVLCDYRAHGFCGMVTKPYQMEELGRVLHGILSI